MSPLLFINQGDVVFTLEGEAKAPEEFTVSNQSRRRKSDILLACNPGKIEKAKAFAMRYVVPAVHQTLELNELSDSHRTPIEHMPRYEELYRAAAVNYPDTTEEQRYGIVQTHIKQWLDKCDEKAVFAGVDAVNGQSQTLRGKDFLDSWKARLGLTLIAVSGATEDTAIRSFSRMPEWMQVLVHKHGAYVSTTTTYDAQKNTRGISLGRNMDLGPLMLFLNPLAFMPTIPDSKHDHTMREELIHELQTATTSSRITTFHRSIIRNPFAEVGEPDDLFIRWEDAAKTVIEAIDADPKHSKPLALIKKANDDEGGSLMIPALRNHPEIRAGELLVDIFDAEIYLRNQGKNKQEAERELRETFGKEAYETAHEYIASWIEEAHQALVKEIGAEKAARHRQNWLDDPFMHSITLNKLPQYDVTSELDLPPHD